MKRRATMLSALCAVLILLGSVAAVGAETENTDEWSVYVLDENEAGLPFFKTPPTHAYTERGLYVTPEESMTMYTVQSDCAYSLEEGFYLEFELEQLSLENTLILHLWDQSGVLVGNYNCGSGWYGMIAVDDEGNDYMMSLIMEEATSDSNGSTDILGSMKVVGHPNGDGTGTYSISMADGILRINGSVVAGMDEILSFLHTKGDDGCFYLGITLAAFADGERLSPLTITRFGKTEATATIPGTDGVLPDTDETPSQSESTTAIADETVSPDDEPVSTPLPSETSPVSGTGTGDADESATEPTETQEGEATGDPSESESTEETRSTLDKMKDVYDDIDVYGSCTSTVSAGGIAGLAVMLAAAFVTRKKD